MKWSKLPVALCINLAQWLMAVFLFTKDDYVLYLIFPVFKQLFIEYHLGTYLWIEWYTTLLLLSSNTTYWNRDWSTDCLSWLTIPCELLVSLCFLLALSILLTTSYCELSSNLIHMSRQSRIISSYSTSKGSFNSLDKTKAFTLFLFFKLSSWCILNGWLYSYKCFFLYFVYHYL